MMRLLITQLLVLSSRIEAFQRSPQLKNCDLAPSSRCSRDDSQQLGPSQLLENARRVTIVAPTTTGVLLNFGNNEESSSSSFGPLLDQMKTAIGLISQPVVWTSLFFVATTGAGFPAGPFGLLGALEGLSYLVIVGTVSSSVYRKITNEDESFASRSRLSLMVEPLSYATLFVGILTLASLAVQQGCVPNAKPLLDYSNFLPVCDAKPGLSGGWECFLLVCLDGRSLILLKGSLSWRWWIAGRLLL